MKLFFEFFPIILFFAAYKMKGIYFAAGAAIAVSICQVAVSYLRTRKVEPMMWVSMLLLIVFGGSGILFRNEWFIKWKPTVLYWLFSGALFVSAGAFRKNLIKAMLQKQLSLPETVWQRLNSAWAVFFAVLGALNLFVAYHFSTGAWVNFKLFGILGCMLVFVVGQGLVLAPFLEKEKTPE
jgi:intracellular septation protein